MAMTTERNGGERTTAERGKAVDAAILAIEKQFGSGSIMKLGSAARQQVDFIPTGSIALDLALGVGGVPRGRITEIFGPESSGKTTVCQHIIAEAQKRGGVAAFIDVEHALDPGYARACGVNVDELLVSQPDTGEQALEITETLIRSGGIDVVVVDSVAALVPRAEIEGEMGDSFVGIQARLMSQALRKLTGAVSRSNTSLVFTNQLREKIGVMFGCFDYSTRIVLADGTTEKIGKIVNQRLPVEVLSMDPATGRVEPRRIVSYFRNGRTDRWLAFEVAAAGGSGRRKFTCTPNHLILTPRGERPAGEIDEGDEVLVAVKHYGMTPDQEQLVLGGVLGDGALRRVSEHGVAFRVGHGVRQRDYLDWKHEFLAPFSRKVGPAGVGLGFDTIPMYQLGWVHDAVYGTTGGGKQAVTTGLIQRLDERAIAVWYADDGTYSGNHARWGHGKAEISAKSLSREHREMLAVRCEELGMGRPTVTEGGLLFSGDRTARFHERIAPYVHPNVGYKLHPRFRDLFEWQPDMSDAHLNGTRLRSRTSLRPVPMRVTHKIAKPAAPRRRTRFDLEIEGNHTYLADHVVVHNSPETTPGGRALKFYASVRLDIRRIETIKTGTESVGNRVRVKVVKNKVAPPFRVAEFDVMYGEGVSKEGGLLDVGVAMGVVDKTGAWFTFEDTRLGQGREASKEFLKSNAQIAATIEGKIRAKVAGGDAAVPVEGIEEAE
ncbi:MAG: recombinase RecA [Chloroflexota bacterium]